METFCKPSSLTRALAIKDVILYASDFDIANYSDELYSLTNTARPLDFENSVIKRRAEFLCGRITAKKALSEFSSSNHQIIVGNGREPIFPKTIIGSITHSNQTALCALASSSKLKYLGIDLEPKIDQVIVTQIEQQIISLKERHVIEDCGLDFGTAFTLVFSAKESLFKALYPQVSEFFDFDAARLTSICPTRKIIEFVLTRNLASNIPRGMRISGKFYIDNLRVLTTIYKHE